MRVALVIERFEPDGGGAERAAWNTALGLADAGDEVCVVARRATPTRRVEIRTVGTRAAARSWKPLRALGFSRAARRAAPRGDFDVVYSFSRTEHQDVYRAGGGSHADYLERRGGGGAQRMRPRHAVQLALERRVFRDPTQLVQCSSRMVRDEIRRRHALPDARLALIRNGVDLERFHPERHRREARALRSELGAGAGPAFLFAGSGFARKGLDTALAALARGPRRAALWVAGGDPHARWQRLAGALGVGDRVRFLGTRSDMPALYPAADALLLPTRYDAFSNACLEAAACGLPVVTTAANGAAEILGPGGVIVGDPEDADSVADALARLSEPDERERLGRAARTIAEGLGWQMHIAALRALFARAQRGDLA